MRQPKAPWLLDDWQRLNAATCRRALAAETEEKAWDIVCQQARGVLRSYSTSFFIVTRFLPPTKRAQVEAIYAAVRYPDEIVDTFDVPAKDATWPRIKSEAACICRRICCGSKVFTIPMPPIRSNRRPSIASSES